MAAPELYAPRRSEAGRARSSAGNGQPGRLAGAAGGQARAEAPRKRGLTYRALTTGIALSALGGFGYYAWTAYNGERTPIVAGEDVVTIAAAAAPLKVAPENPGGLAVLGRDYEFFEGVRGQRLAVRPDEEYVLPPPETPIINPEPEMFDRPPPVPMELAVSRPDNDTAEVSAASTASAEAEPAPSIAGAGVSVPPVLSAPMLRLPDLDPQQLATRPAAGDASDAPAQDLVAATTESRPQTVIDTLVAAVDHGAVPPTDQGASQPGVAPAATVQLASMRSRDLAEQEWRRLSRLLPDLLGDREPLIRASTNNDRTFYRVSIAAVGAVEAAALCAAIKDRNFDCIVHD